MGGRTVRSGVVAVFILLLAPAVGRVAWAQPVPAGAEFVVSSNPTYRQRRPAVAADADGDFVIAWVNALDETVVARRYDSSGTPRGNDFQVNTYTTTYHAAGFPAVAADADGDFVVVWASVPQDGNSYGIFGQRYNSAGMPQGGEFQVNTYTTASQNRPAVAVDADGDFVVVWASYSSQDGSGSGVFGQRYNSAGMPQGGEFQVNTYTTGGQGVGYFPVNVAADADGDFVVVWGDTRHGFSDMGVFGQRYNSAGMPQGGEFQVNTYTTGFHGYPALATDATGNFVVVWTGPSDTTQYGIFARRYASTGTPQGAEFQVNTYTGAGYKESRGVAADADGDFVVTWRSNDQDGSYSGVFARRYDSTGTPQGGEFQVNTSTYRDQGYYYARVAAEANGDFVVVWEQRSTGYDFVFAQRYTLDSDGVDTSVDNCPNEANPDLLDSDNDGTGDVCDPCPLLVANTCDADRSGGASIASAGGAFTTPDGSITVNVPPGVLSSGTSVSVTESVNGFVIDPDGSFLALYKVGLAPDGQHFSQPVTITFRWDDRDSDGRVDRGTCQGGQDAGLSCDENTDCPASTCSTISNPNEGNLILKRNGNRFSKNGFGATVTEAKCSSHQAGGGCETAVADCTDPAGTAMATVANCCDTVNNAWVFQTCDFSEFSIGDLETIVLPVFSPAGWMVLSAVLALGLGGAVRIRWRRPAP